MVAQYADGCNLFAADGDRARHLLGVLEAHCERLGRDPGEITKTGMGAYVIADTDRSRQGQDAPVRRGGADAARSEPR